MTDVQTFAQAFDTRQDVKDATLRALSEHLEEVKDEPTTWNEVIHCLTEAFGSSPTVKNVEAVSIGETLLYPLATYGWAGGNAINSTEFNLTDLGLVHLFGGPCASIVRRTDPSYPGIAIHYAESERILMIQLF